MLAVTNKDADFDFALSRLLLTLNWRNVINGTRHEKTLFCCMSTNAKHSKRMLFMWYM